MFGNQTSFTADSIVYTNYTYRPDGLRHSIGDKVHVWDGSNIVADVNSNDVVVYIRGINLIYADDGDKIYYHFNAHGDVVVLTNSNGSKTKSYSYNAFGVERNEATLDENPFRYCGEYYDKETKTIYLRARYYDAEQGRFTQEDPIRDGYNWYAYCGNNPIMFVDPSGYAVRDCFSDETDMLDSPDMTSMGIGGGGKIISSYDSTAYNSYSIRSNTARYDASLGGYYSGGISSATANPGYYIIPEAQTVTDDMVEFTDAKTNSENSIDKSNVGNSSQNASQTPDIKYPGNDPTVAPKGYTWRGKGVPGSNQGNYYNPIGKKSLHPDLYHPLPIGPHWDYNYKNSGCNGWRIFPDGRIVPKP